MNSIRDSFEFDGSYKEEYTVELQTALDRLEQLVLHAGQFHNQDDSTIWEYARENSSDNLAYTIINLISAGLKAEDFDRVNELIYSLEDKQ